MNIVLIVVDTLRADHLGCYGYARRTSPHIDALAASGVRFEWCYSQAPWTIPSFSTILTGLYPERHRVVGSPWNVPNATGIFVDDRTPMLAELLQAGGYVTAAFDNLHQMASHPRWFPRGFNYYVNCTPRPGLVHHHVRADQIHLDLEPWLEAHRRDRFFAFVHYWEPHLPYNQPAPYDRLFAPAIDVPVEEGPNGPYVPRWGATSDLTGRALKAIADYDGEISFVDEYVGRLVAHLENLGLLDETLIVFSGDHGESMVEHGVWFDHFELYDATVHVPLVIAGADVVPGGVVDALVEHVDLVPTLLEAAAVERPADLSGRSLGSFLAGRTPTSWRQAAHAVQDGTMPSRMVRTADWKLIQRFARGADHRVTVVGRELFDVRADPCELRNVSASRPDAVAELERDLAAWLEATTAGRGGDPLNAPELTVDFLSYPPDPVLREFYKWVRGDEPTAAQRVP